jgi:cytochrome c peroxidase
MTAKMLAVAAVGLMLVGAGCKRGEKAVATIDPAQLSAFAPLPAAMESPANPLTDAKVNLGRALFYETRLSRDNDVSCNSCHKLDAYGVDGRQFSLGTKQQLGGRNSPSVYNAAGQIAQFWDGRAATVEEQAKGPILNPVEMTMPSAAAVVARLKAVRAYQEAFRRAFPGSGDPITYDNVGLAIGAFERRLVTPARWDQYLKGDTAALTPAERQGFNTFVATGCQACHTGALVGGGMYQKLGMVRPWPDHSDIGRAAITHLTSDTLVFKVPSLRNVARTAPYFHNGSVKTLNEAVTLMAAHQLGRDLTPQQVAEIVTYLNALTGELPASYIAPRAD